MISSLLRDQPEAPFLVADDQVLTRGAAADRLERRARRLEGDLLVPLEIEPSFDAVLELLAVLAAGRVAAPLNLREPESIRTGLRRQLSRSVVPPGPALLVRTSGTTAQGKWVWLELAALLHGARCAVGALDFGPDAAWLLHLPLYHVGGLGPVWRALVSGGALALPGAAFSHASVVTTQLQRLLAGELPRAWNRCRRVLLGGGPVADGLVEAAAARGLTVTTSYGMTETGSLCVADGRPIGSCEIRIQAEEIQLRGPALFRGYLDLASARLTRPDAGGGWFPTGDLGSLDGGFLRVGGRRDNQFVSGGENIQPEEIEQALLELGGIEEAVVVPVPDAEFGRRPVAFVRPLRPGLAADLAGVLPGYKVPVRFLALPPAGEGAIKPSRAALAALLRSDS
jgi:O-succinylbenzoic acid--CoA ligase